MSEMHAEVGGDDLVTGEAVALQLPAATIGVRVASGLIDLTVETLALVGATLAAAVLTRARTTHWSTPPP